MIYKFYFEPDVMFKYKEIWDYFMEKIGWFFESLEFSFTSNRTSFLFVKIRIFNPLHSFLKSLC